MKHFAKMLISFLILILCYCSSGSLFNDPVSKVLYYKTVEEKVKKMDPNADFTKLRLSFSETPYYNPYGTNDLHQEMHLALKENNLNSAVDKAEEILKNNFVNIDAHHVCEIINDSLGFVDKKDFHKYMTKGLIQSILKSGDGKTKESAFVVISTEEEYVIIAVLGMKLNKQALITDNGHNYDLMSVNNPKTNKDIDIYFNIDIPFNWMNKQFK